jgi:hypothetical protein
MLENKVILWKYVGLLTKYCCKDLFFINYKQQFNII